RLLQEFQRMLMKHVGDVPCFLQRASIDIQFRIILTSLSFETRPKVPTWSAGVVIAHMPFTHESRLITRVMQQSWKRGQLVTLRTAIRVVSDAVRMGIQSR